jgi:hypothetical protein
MNPNERLALDAMTRSVDASAELRAHLRRAETAYRKAIIKIEAGADFQSTMDRANMAASLHRVAEGLKALEQARHQSRISLVRISLERGMSISDIARVWGVSRQLAARYAKEARREI